MDSSTGCRPEEAAAVEAEAPHPPSLKRKGDGNEKTEIIARMNQRGMSMDVIAEILCIETDEVVASLVKRTRAEDGGSAAAESSSDTIGEEATSTGESVNEEGLTSLTSRLMTDPDDFCCPILHSLMEDPVVAEDGNTYEREAIESALQLRQYSPISGAAMGKQVLPNQGIKSQIANFKEKAVAEIISVVPRIPSGEAAKLLRRAEEFMRPKMPEASARIKMVELLQLRTNLPAVLRGDAVKQLLEILVTGEDNAPLSQLFTRFEALDFESMLPGLDERIVARLQAVAQTLPPQASQKRLDMELACRLARREPLSQGAQALWQLMLQVSGRAEPGDWLDIAGLVMAALFKWLDLDIAGLAEGLLHHAVEYLQNPGLAASRAEDLFKSSLGINADDSPPPNFLARIFLELASRKSPDKAAQLPYLVKARKADPFDVDVRKHLLELLAEDLGVEGKTVDEGLLLSLLFEEHDKVPDHLLAKLSLEPQQMAQVAPSFLVILAKQLSKANRSPEGASIAVLAAKAFEATGAREEAQKAYISAYGMDRSNLDASHGIVEMCSQASQRCVDLEEKGQEQQCKIQRLEQEVQNLKEQLTVAKGTLEHLRNHLTQPMVMAGHTVEWDLSTLDVSQFPKGAAKNSPTFRLTDSDVSAWLVFYPNGNSSAPAGKASLFLQLSKQARATLDGTFRIDGRSASFNALLTPSQRSWGYKDFFDVAQAYTRVTCTFKEIKVDGSGSGELQIVTRHQ